MHEGRFRNPSLRWCPLVTNLTGANLSDIADGKALQDPQEWEGASVSAASHVVQMVEDAYKAALAFGDSLLLLDRCRARRTYVHG